MPKNIFFKFRDSFSFKSKELFGNFTGKSETFCRSAIFQMTLLFVKRGSSFFGVHRKHVGQAN